MFKIFSIAAIALLSAGAVHVHAQKPAARRAAADLGEHRFVLTPVPGTPCMADCDDPTSPSCQKCCRTVTHEVDWGCNTLTPASTDTAACCTGDWDAACWNVASAANHDHACNQCGHCWPYGEVAEARCKACGYTAGVCLDTCCTAPTSAPAGKKGKGKKGKKEAKSSKSSKSPKEPKSAKAPKKGKAAGLEAKQSQAARLEVGAGVALVGMVGLVALVATKIRASVAAEDEAALLVTI